MFYDILANMSVLVASAGDLFVGASTDALMKSAKAIVGPILLFCIGIAAIPYIWNKQITQIVMFALTAILVIFLFYGTDFIKGITESGAKDLGNKGGKW